jgi:putative ABC transport system permease protein
MRLGEFETAARLPEIQKLNALVVGIGLVCGIGSAFAMTWYLKSLLYEVSTTDPLVFSSTSAGLVLVALLAMSVPAYRATRVDPLEALRHE